MVGILFRSNSLYGTWKCSDWGAMPYFLATNYFALTDLFEYLNKYTPVRTYLSLNQVHGFPLWTYSYYFCVHLCAGSLRTQWKELVSNEILFITIYCRCWLLSAFALLLYIHSIVIHIYFYNVFLQYISICVIYIYIY